MIDNLKIGKKYNLNEKAAVYMGMFSDLSQPLAGFHLFVLMDDGFIKALRKTDIINEWKDLVV